MPHMQYLIQAREQQGWTQQELANRLGVSRLTVSRWEQGEMRPRAPMRRQVALLLEQPEDILFTTRPLDEVSVLPAPIRAQDRVAVLDPLIPTIQHALVGRETAVSLFRARLCTGGSVALTALNGLPGVGKTTLATALVYDTAICQHFSDGILWAGLGPHPNITTVFSHWGSLLDITHKETSTREEWARALRAAIGHRRMLLVIDDAWTLEDALAFKIGGPHCAYILTTRFADLARFFSPDGAHALDELDEEQSMELLRGLAAEVVTREEQKTRDLIRAVGGLPLALTLIGNYLRRQGHAGQSRRLAMAYDHLRHPEARLQLAEPRGAVDAHPSLPVETQHLSLHAVIAVTDQHLSEATRQALYALSVFPAKPHSFSEAAALFVAACDYEILDVLVDAGLMTAFGERLTLHQTIADYAHVHLQADPSFEEKTQLRLVAYIREFVLAHRQDQQALDRELPAILVALDIAVAQRRHELGEMLLAMAPHFRRTGLYRQLAQYARSALLLTHDDEETWRLKLLLGRALQALGQFAEAHAIFAQGVQALQQAQQIQPLLLEYYALLGKMLEKMGRYQEAERSLREGLALARQHGIQEKMTQLLLYLGATLDIQGHCQQAYIYRQEGLALARQQGDEEEILAHLIGMGASVGTVEIGLAPAEDIFLQALALARKLRYLEPLCVILINLADLERQEGTPQALRKAEQYLQEGLAIAETIGLQEWLAILLLTSAAVKIKQRRYHAAALALDRCLALVDQLNTQNRLRTQAYEYRGELALALQHLEEAETWLTRAWEICPVEDIETLAMILFGYARLCEARGDRTLARAWAQQSARYYSRLGPRLVVPVEQWLAAHPTVDHEDKATVVAAHRRDDP